MHNPNAWLTCALPSEKLCFRYAVSFVLKDLERKLDNNQSSCTVSRSGNSGSGLCSCGNYGRRRHRRRRNAEISTNRIVIVCRARWTVRRMYTVITRNILQSTCPHDGHVFFPNFCFSLFLFNSFDVFIPSNMFIRPFLSLIFLFQLRLSNIVLILPVKSSFLSSSLTFLKFPEIMPWFVSNMSLFLSLKKKIKIRLLASVFFSNIYSIKCLKQIRNFFLSCIIRL